MSRRVRWVLIVVAIVITAGIVADLMLRAPEPAKGEAVGTYYSRSFHFALAWDRGLFSMHRPHTGPDASVGVPGIGRLHGEFLTLTVVLSSPAGLPADERGEMFLTTLRPTRMPSRLASLNRSTFELAASGGEGWGTATLNLLHALRRQGTEKGLTIRDYVTAQDDQVYWIRLEAASTRWSRVESRLDAVAQTLVATTGFRNSPSGAHHMG